MTETVVACLTPPGTGAIATLALRGPSAWAIVRRLFRPQVPLEAGYFLAQAVVLHPGRPSQLILPVLHGSSDGLFPVVLHLFHLRPEADRLLPLLAFLRFFLLQVPLLSGCLLAQTIVCHICCL